MNKYTGIPIKELKKVLDQITPDNFPYPEPGSEAPNYRRIWVFRKEPLTTLHFSWDEESHKKILNEVEGAKIIGEIELHWSTSQNDWFIRTLIL